MPLEYMTDLTAFMSHLYSEIPSVSEPVSVLYGTLEIVLAKGRVSAFKWGTLCWTILKHTDMQIMCVCKSNLYFVWYECATSKLSKPQFCVGLLKLGRQ